MSVCLFILQECKQVKQIACMELMEVPEIYNDEEWDDPPYNITSKKFKCLPVSTYTWACTATCSFHVAKAIESYNCLVE